jgi:O-antigen/teichoic acid export membrane protein
MDKEVSIRHAATHGVKWSIIQNWGGKVFTFFLSIILARLLSPTDFGTASAVALILLIIPLIAELGFGDAIMQRPALKPSDLNLPFLLSLAVVALMFAGIVLMADQISLWLEITDGALYIVAASGVLLMTTPSMFQEAMYKRTMQFRSLALRTFLANIVGGIAAVFCAWGGLGIWSFVVQGYIAGLISVVWLWWNPRWLPSWALDTQALVQMTRFGIPVVFQRLIDFAGTKIVDFIIVTQLGLAAYGMYAIASRIYQTMMQLLQGAFYDISLTVLSTISHDRERMAQLYIKSIGLAATYISPIFVLVAALAPEVCHVLLGHKWAGVEDLVPALLILGALQSVQFINGPFISARGRPEFILYAGIIKSASAIILLLLIKTDSIQSITILFTLSLLVATPVTFFFVKKELKFEMVYLCKALIPSAVNGLVCFFLVTFCRPYVATIGLPDFFQGVALGAIFTTCWTVMLALTDYQRFSGAARVIKSKLKRKTLF